MYVGMYVLDSVVNTKFPTSSHTCFPFLLNAWIELCRAKN